MLEIVFV